jgi:alkylation response protein AidB-like acyl-CoA dehydrogenase
MASKGDLIRTERQSNDSIDGEADILLPRVQIPPQRRTTAPQPGHPVASSSTEGFFQTPPVVLPQIEDDIALQRSFKLFLPKAVQDDVSSALETFSHKVLSKPILGLIADAEKNHPYLKTWTAWGKRQDELVTSEGWRRLSAIGIEEGMVAIPYENTYAQFSRPWHFLKYLVWTGSSCWVTCPSLMTDGVATLLRNHLSDTGVQGLSRDAMQSAYDRLVSRDPEHAWTTGQWMTERQGGSDVSQTETLATYDPRYTSTSMASDGVAMGPWSVNGFKWFSSATDSQMMVFLARTPNGISTFMAPMRRTTAESNSHESETELNGIQIQRLKNKLGTKALPTAELVLKDVRAHLIGTEGQGVKEIATVLNVARVHNAVTAIGLWGRGLSIIRAFGRSRKVGLKPLWTKAAFMRSLARMHIEYKANVLLCTFVASLLGVIEQPQIAAYRNTAAVGTESSFTLPKADAATHLFRLLASVLKGLTAKSAIAGLAECMECMGGVGYLENEDQLYNIARLYRDVNVCSIWEGTTDMMAHDVLRVVFGKTASEVLAAMDEWVAYVCEAAGKDQSKEAEIMSSLWKQWCHDMRNKDRGELELRSREYMQKLGDVVMGSLMILDAISDGNDIAVTALHSWMDLKGHYPETKSVKWQDIVQGNMKVVFGPSGPDDSAHTGWKAKL